jgi:hypothetical protein
MRKLTSKKVRGVAVLEYCPRVVDYHHGAHGMSLTTFVSHDAGIDIMSYEAAKVVSEEISKRSVSDECRILVVCRVLSFYLQEVEQVDSLVLATDTTSFKLIAPLLGEGMQSAMALEVLGESETQNSCGKRCAMLWCT